MRTNPGTFLDIYIYNLGYSISSLNQVFCLYHVIQILFILLILNTYIYSYIYYALININY
jgi:hypothetical protein